MVRFVDRIRKWLGIPHPMEKVCRRRGDGMLFDIENGFPLVRDEVFGLNGHPHCAPHFTDQQWAVIWPAWCTQLSETIAAKADQIG